MENDIKLLSSEKETVENEREPEDDSCRHGGGEGSS
jgi:hypothetical protein